MRKFLLPASLAALLCLPLWTGVGASANRPAVSLPPAEKVVVASPTPIHEVRYKVLKTLDLSQGTVLNLSGEVGQDTKELPKQIKAASKAGLPIYLLIDSPGGSVMDGAQIISAMQASKAPVYTVCLQLCASMAAMILEYGHERYALDRSVIMFHPASMATQAQGEVDKIVSRMLFLQRFIDKMNSYVAMRSGLTYDSFKRIASVELWLDGEDATERHFVDRLVRLENEGGLKLEPSQDDVKRYLNQVWKANVTYGSTKTFSFEVR